MFHITDYDSNEDVSDTASEGDSLSASDSEDGAPEHAEAAIQAGENAQGAAIQAGENTQDQAMISVIEELGTDFVVTDEAVLAAFEEDESEEDESEDENTLIPVTDITSIDDDDVEDNATAEYAVDDHTAKEIDLHFSSARPRWTDRERGREDVKYTHT